MQKIKSVIIVGGGIVGLSTAYYLNRKGIACTVIDAKSPGRETSFGNAGSVSVGNIFPQAMPGIVKKAFGMLMNPLAPLKINWCRPSTVLPWLLRFILSAQQKRVRETISALHTINQASLTCWHEMTQDLKASDLVQPLGYLHIYSDAKTFERGEWEREIMRSYGVRFDVLDREALHLFEPNIGEDFQYGVFQKDSLAVLNPGELCERLTTYLSERGVQFHSVTVSNILDEGECTRVISDNGTFVADAVVVAAGVWSKRLLSSLGIHLPIIPARGYHLMFEKKQTVVSRPTLWAERYMVLTPMNYGVRMTSIKELTTLDSDPQFRFIRRLKPEANKLFPALHSSVVSEWMGNRPCTPDSLPILDKVPHKNIYIASGHGHMGLTQGPGTGKWIADWIETGKAEPYLAPFSLSRF